MTDTGAFVSGENRPTGRGSSYRLSAMNFSKLERGEVIAIVGGLVLAISVFLAWYKTGNANSTIGPFNNVADKQVSAWDVLTLMRYALLAAAAAPVILAWIIVREHALSWPRGELTAVVGITALTLVFVRGIILRPGEPSGQIHLSYGWFVALLGCALILAGAAWRSSEVAKARKAPGTI